jgi:hypothetical protein
MAKVSEFVFETFLRLTSKTYPYGYEDDLIKQMSHSDIFPDGLSKDEYGNYFYNIGNTRTIFASHLDTVSKDHVAVNHVFDGNIIKTDGKTTLGADDKAGVTVMLWMIKNKVPGMYYFFIGEEVGCIGSGLASKHGNFKGLYDRIISFDRRDTNSVITYQSSSRCCSDTFANKLCSELNKNGLSYKKDDGGVYTDSAEFVSLIPECTNISVGYYSEHTTKERQDIKHLIALADACVKVNWNDLPVVRDMSKKEYKSYSNYDSTYGGRGRASYGHNNYGCSNYGNSNWNWDDNDYKNKSRGKTYNLDGILEDEVESIQGKKTRRGNSKKKKGKTYYDNGGSLIDITREFNRKWNDEQIDTSDRYSWLVDKFVDDKFTWSELQALKEQYLDMSITYDETMYEYLKTKVIDL